MSDTRLAELLAEHEYATSDYVVIHSCNCDLGVVWGDYTGYVQHVTEVVAAEFLVIPRTETTREYAAESEPGGHLLLISDRAVAVNDATRRGVQVFERPVLPWSPIPLPEDAGQ